MSDTHETVDDVTEEASDRSFDEFGPDDATARGAITGFHEISGPSRDDADPSELASAPEPVRMDLDWQPPAGVTLRDVAEQIARQGLTLGSIEFVPIDHRDEASGEDMRIPLQQRPDAAELPEREEPADQLEGGAAETADTTRKIELDQETRGRLRPAVLKEADTLVDTFAQVRETAEQRGDDYFTDATGNVQSIVTNNTKKNGELSDAARIGTMRRATIDLTNYAVKTGDEASARAAFGKLQDGDKWLVYAEAYETAKVDPQLLADWRHELDVAHEAGTQDQSRMTQASRLFALTKGKLHDYTSTIDPQRLASLREQQGAPAEGTGTGPSLEDLAAAREEHKQMAVEYGAQLGQLLKAIQSSDTTTDEFLSRTWPPQDYEDAATAAFARAGIWEGAEALNERHSASYINGLSQTIRAIHGQLGKVERLQLRTSSTGKVLRWLNEGEQAAGNPPKIDTVPTYMRKVLEQVEPKRMQRLGLGQTNPDRSLRMAIDAGDFESVRAHYTAVLDRHVPSANLRAALMVSQYLYDVQATEAAHDVFEGALLDEITPVEARVGDLYEPGFDGDVGEELTAELDRLYTESAKLKDPVTSLHAKARIATMFLMTEPNSQRVGELVTDIQTQWNVLERRDGGDQELARLYQSLRSAGFQLEPQWKRDGVGGFIGYRPISPLMVRRDPSDYQPFRCGGHINIEMADELLRTADTLNRLLGTERYQVEVDNEDVDMVEAFRAHRAQRTSTLDLFPHRYTSHTVELTGPWRVLFSNDDFGCSDEFEAAAGNIRSGWEMHSNEALSGHLRQLIDQAEAAWQEEQAVAA